jgi:hypothetical protein
MQQRRRRMRAREYNNDHEEEEEEEEIEEEQSGSQQRRGYDPRRSTSSLGSLIEDSLLAAQGGGGGGGASGSAGKDFLMNKFLSVNEQQYDIRNTNPPQPGPKCEISRDEQLRKWKELQQIEKVCTGQIHVAEVHKLFASRHKSTSDVLKSKAFKLIDELDLGGVVLRDGSKFVRQEFVRNGKPTEQDYLTALIDMVTDRKLILPPEMDIANLIVTFKLYASMSAPLKHEQKFRHDDRVSTGDILKAEMGVDP